MLLSKILAFIRKYYVLILATIFVVVLSAITYHFDFYTLTRMAQRVGSGDLDIYKPLDMGAYWNGLRGVKESGSALMPPLIFLLDGFLYFILAKIHIISFVVTDQFPTMLQILALKSRYILLFLASYPLIKKVAWLYTKDELFTKRISYIWITSPLLLYLPFTQGNNDIFPVIFVLIFLLFSFKKKYVLAMIFLGLAACLKNYALFLFFPAALILAEKDIGKTIKYLLVAAVSFLTPLLFFYKDLQYFSTGGGEGLLILNTRILSDIPFAIFPVLYFVIILFLVLSNNKNDFIKEKGKNLILYLFLVTSLFFVSSYFFPQWFLWILPFMILTVYKNKKAFLLYILLCIALFAKLLTFYQNNLDIFLFKPIFLEGINYFNFGKNKEVTLIIQALFTASYSLLLYFAIKERDKLISFTKEWYYLLLSATPTVILMLFIVLNLILSRIFYFS